MKLPDFKGVVGVVKTFAMANRPEILLATALTATVATGVLAARGGYKAHALVIDEQLRLGRETTTKEKIQLTWLCYIPATIAASTALGSVAGLHLVHVKEKKALATAGLAALEEAKKSAKVYQEEVLEANVDENGVSKIVNSDGEIEELYLVRDPITGRDIWSNKTRIEEAITEVGNMVNGSDGASLNNFYESAGWGRLHDAEYVGWSGVLPAVSWNDENQQPIIGVRDDGRPFRSFRFLPSPEKDFDDPKRAP